MNSARIKNGWFSNMRGDILAGITVALALIPEAIAFAIIAGVDPMVGIYASFTIAVTIAFTGGRPGMISAATGAMALLMVTLVRDHGLEYLLAATVLTGVIQFLLGLLKFGRFFTFMPQSVIIGFVNALAIMIFMAQLPHFVGESWIMYAMVAGTLAIIYLLPRITKALPSALVAIIIMSVLAITMDLEVRTVGDMGEITQALPLFSIPSIPFTWDTLLILLPYSLPLALVGITESLLTATIVDEMTETKSDKNREIRGQGIANFITGLFGGMAGCAMIGQSVINVKSGGRQRLSTLVAGVFLLFLILVLGDVVKQIPMGALVGVMFMVSLSTFNWRSVIELRKMPLSDAFVMIAVVAVVIATSDLALGVLSGIIISTLVFGWKMARMHTLNETVKNGTKHYTISGQLFFGTTQQFTDLFDYKNDPAHVVIDMSHSHVWDHSAVVTIGKVIAKYDALDKQVQLIGLNDESRALINRIGLHA